jgi:N-acetylglutamate synthase/N-acetylornithine aminotransferase
MKKKQTKKAVAVPGFRFSGITAGIKKSRKKDIALISSDNEAVIAGTCSPEYESHQTEQEM